MTETTVADPAATESIPVATTTEPDQADLAAAVLVRAAVSSGGLVGGVGIKARDADRLQQELHRPDGPERVTQLLTARVHEALGEAGITYGIAEEGIAAAAAKFIDSLGGNQAGVVTHKVAEGEAPVAGADARIEYALNYRGQPFSKLASLSPRSTRRNCHVVSAGQVLAVLHPAQPPSDGASVTGEAIELDAEPASTSLSTVAGDNTQVCGTNLTASCDGLCEEDTSGWIRVVPEVVIDSVDATTGRVPESGISQANIAVRGEVRGEFGVATCENLFVGEGEAGGGISGSAQIQARNLVAIGTVAGPSEGRGAPITVGETCVAGEVVGRSLNADRILVARDSHLGQLEADSEIRIDGSVRGGAIRCPAYTQVAGDLGTESGGSNTRIILPPAESGSRRQRQRAAAAKEYKETAATLREELGVQAEKSDQRAKTDPYWSRLIDGEAAEPTNPMQKKAYQQFEVLAERKRQLEQQITALDKALQRVQREDEEGEGGDSANAATLVVGGRIHPDTVFEVLRELQGEDGDLPVSFTHDGKRFRGHKLSDVRSQLTQAVGAYLERQGAQVEEKRAAIEKMFEGQEARPTGPKVTDRKFEIGVTWAQQEDADEHLEMSAVVFLHSDDPQRIMVRNLARPRHALTRVSVRLEAEGALGVFSVRPAEEEVISWQKDPSARDDLAAIKVSGVSAWQALRGEADYAASPTAEPGKGEEGGD